MATLKRVHSFKCTGLIRRVILSWLLAVTMEFLLLPEKLRDLAGLEGMAQMSLLRVAAITLCGTVFLAGVSRLVNSARAERWGFAVLFTLLAAAVLRASFTWAYLVICILILTLLIVFGVYGWNGSPNAGAACGKEHRAYFWITGGLTLTFFLFVSAWTVGRVYSFRTPTFDFGIFSQMFYYMKKTGLPMTTVERDGILSHFAVHVSPIYYLMLPFYWLVPAPATLQVLQAAVMASSVIPLWKIGILPIGSRTAALSLCWFSRWPSARPASALRLFQRRCATRPNVFAILTAIRSSATRSTGSRRKPP